MGRRLDWQDEPIYDAADRVIDMVIWLVITGISIYWMVQ